MASLDKFAVNTTETAVAFAVGFALGRALEPVGTKIAQDAWTGHPDRAIDPGTAAEIVAEEPAVQIDGAAEAAAHGIDSTRFAALVGLALAAPGTGELLRMLRRGTIHADDFAYGLRKARLNTRFDSALAELKDERIDPAVIATAIQRGVMHDPGVLVVGPPSGSGKVPPMPVSPLDTLLEAAASGIDEERLAVYARIVGLPASPDLAARMVFRQIIDRVDFDRAIAEGNTRNEWAASLFEGFREILTANQYAELQLRGFLSADARRANTAKHGMSDADSDLLYDVLGRSIPVHAITTGLARGGTYGGTGEGIPAEYLASLQRGNLRPEYYDLAYANRYTYPSAFVVRQLLKDGTITEAEGEQIFLDGGWTPELAKKVAAAYAVATVAKSDPHVAKAETQLWGTIHRSFLAGESDDAEVTAALALLGVPAEAQTQILALWQHEREIIRRSLTRTDVRKLWKDTKLTRDEAVARIVAMGYTAADAGAYLDE